MMVTGSEGEVRARETMIIQCSYQKEREDQKARKMTLTQSAAINAETLHQMTIKKEFIILV